MGQRVRLPLIRIVTYAFGVVKQILKVLVTCCGFEQPFGAALRRLLIDNPGILANPRKSVGITRRERRIVILFHESPFLL